MYSFYTKSIQNILLIYWLRKQIHHQCSNKKSFLDPVQSLLMRFVTNTTYANNFVNELINLTILTGKDWCFTQFSKRMTGWLLLILFICLHNQLSSIHSIISTDVWRFDSSIGDIQKVCLLKIPEFPPPPSLFALVRFWAHPPPIPPPPPPRYVPFG